MKKLFLIASIISINLFFGCSQSDNSQTKVILDIRMQGEQSTASSLTRATSQDITLVTVAVTGLVEPVRVDLNSQEVILEVPAGNNREFVVRAFNNMNELIFRGSAVVNIKAGEETLVVIFLVPVGSVSPNPDTPYAISGIVSGDVVAGVTVTLGGSSDALVLTDAGGNYSFSNLANGSYTVTPSYANYVFTPSSLNVVISGTDQTGINFTATRQFSISGTVSGDAAAGIAITLSGADSLVTLTDSSGNYSFTNLANGSYTVTPALSNYGFSPANQTVVISGSDQTGINFTSAGQFTISGTITGDLLQGITVSLSGKASATATSDASGNYAFYNLANGSYTVTPAIADYGFNPLNQSVTISSADQTGQNFTSIANPATVNITLQNEDASSYAWWGTSDNNLTVSGSGMSNISNNYASGTFSVSVPSGTNRLFSVVGTPDTNMQTAVIYLSGQGTADLAPGEIKPLTITLKISETKIVIPDYWNYRLIQINDMTGTGWITKNATSMNLSSISLSILSPYDVDFDAKGRIYIANNDVSTSSAIIRIDNINDTTPEIAGGVGISSLVAVKVDRSNGLLYYATASQLYRNNLTNSAQILLTTTGISLIKGFTVDSTGTLDIACYFSTPASYAVLKYNPTAQSAGIYYSISPGTPWDVLYKSPYIYVANLSGTVDTQIIRLNASDLTSPLGYGTQVDVSSTNPGEFYGPRRFVAILNKRITLIDDHNSPYPYDKLISMNDITGTIDWQTFGNDTGMGGTFDFYTQC